MCFTRDLTFGKKYEEIAKQLTGEVILESPTGKFSDYDFKTDVSTYEVKSDRLAYKYGCKTMFIEFECGGNPSGINVSIADFWFYFMVKPDGSYICYKIPIGVLREECCSSRIVSGGDGGRVRGYIVMTERLQDYKLHIV